MPRVSAAHEEALELWNLMLHGAGVPPDKERLRSELSTDWWDSGDEGPEAPAYAFPAFSSNAERLVRFHIGDGAGSWLEEMAGLLEGFDAAMADFDPFALDFENPEEVSRAAARPGIVIDYLCWRFVLSALLGRDDHRFLEICDPLWRFMEQRAPFDPYAASGNLDDKGAPIPGPRVAGEDAGDHRYRILHFEGVHADRLLLSMCRGEYAEVVALRDSRLSFPESDTRRSARQLINLSARLARIAAGDGAEEHAKAASRLLAQLTVNYWSARTKSVPQFVDVSLSRLLAARFAHARLTAEAPDFELALAGWHPDAAEAALKESKRGKKQARPRPKPADPPVQNAKIYDLALDTKRIARIQEASQGPGKFGYESDHGLFGSDAWWEAVSSGAFPIKKESGVIMKIDRAKDGTHYWMKSKGKDRYRQCLSTRIADVPLSAKPAREIYRKGSRVRIRSVQLRARAGGRHWVELEVSITHPQPGDPPVPELEKA